MDEIIPRGKGIRTEFGALKSTEKQAGAFYCTIQIRIEEKFAETCRYQVQDFAKFERFLDKMASELASKASRYWRDRGVVIRAESE